jgi:hypothetical protein
MSAIEVVQRQLDAYNAHDLAGFTAAYSDAVEVFRMPSAAPAIAGKAQFAEFYASHRFNIPELKAEVLNRMLLGGKIVDHERIWGLGAAPIEAVAVYRVVDDLIDTVWFFYPD